MMQELGFMSIFFFLNIYLKACPVSFSQSIECLIFNFYPELLSEGGECLQLQWLLI